MTRVYENKGYWRRQTISVAILIAVMIYGAWELWHADSAPTGGFGMLLGIGQDGYIFGVVFLGGGIYGLWQVIRDASDVVESFDLDEATGATVTTLWRPFRSVKLNADLKAITHWRFHIKLASRNVRVPYIYADHPDRPTPLIFDLRRSDPEGLRKIAPEAIAEYEAATRRQPKNVS